MPTPHTTRPVIGIVPSFDEGNMILGGDGEIRRVFLRREYLDMIARAGAIPLIISPEIDLKEIVKLCHGVVISGGADIDPDFYGEERLPEVQRTEPRERFAWEKSLIEACEKAHIPILGICYGLQRLNVHYGGSLIQDIGREIGHTINHEGSEHDVTFSGSFLGFSQGDIRHIASRHHQAVGRLADGFEICAKSPDGVVEAIKRGHCYGMQWHPESDLTGAHVYHAFVEICQN